MKKYLPSTKTILQSIFLVALLGTWFLLEEKRNPTPQYPVPPRVPPMVAPGVGETKLTPVPIVSRSSKATADEIIEKIKACEVRRLEIIQYDGGGGPGIELIATLEDSFILNLSDKKNLEKVVHEARLTETSCEHISIEEKVVTTTCSTRDCI